MIVAALGSGMRAYFRGGQVEAVYMDMQAFGLSKFAPLKPARARCSRLGGVWD